MYEAQIELERQMRSQGAARVQEARIQAEGAGRENETRPGRGLINSIVLPTATAVTAYREHWSSTRGPRPVFLTTTETLEPETVALITAKVAVAGLSKNRMFTRLAVEVGRALEDEVRFRHYSEQNHALFETLAKDLKSRPTSWAYQRRLVINRMRKAEVSFKVWRERERLHTGIRALDLLIEATDMFTVEMVVRGRETRVNLFVATPETLTWLQRGHDNDALLHPLLLPMLVPPKPWTAPQDGGYLTMQHAALVKSHNRQYNEDLRSVHMPAVYSAVNKVQSVAWRVNRRVYETQRAMWANGDQDAGLPPGEDAALPEKMGFPEKVKVELMTTSEVAALARWKRETASAHRTNRENTSKRLAQASALVIAQAWLDKAEFYFPHHLDWRGRIYPIPQVLHPQANDAGRSMLEFAEGKPVGDRGKTRVAIYGASCWGYDKVSLTAMRVWTAQNESRILACAADPLGQRWWTEADNPFAFLAFCFDWQGVVKDGATHVSHLPIAVDGTCNGIQHFCMMVGDREGAAAVNLLPSDEPSDIYQQVANRVIEALEEKREALEDGAILAQQWLEFGVDRYTVKRPVMTLPYGATKFGFTDQIMTDTLRPAQKAGEPFPFETDGHAAAIFLANLVWDAINLEVNGAIVVMRWLQSLASIVSKSGAPLHWTAPSGFPVYQRYTKTRSVRVESNIMNRRLQIRMLETTEKLDANRQRLGVAPNFVHSCDASHQVAVLNMLETLVPGCSFGGVHDSFATHACDIEDLMVAIKSTMVEQYSAPVMAQFHAEASAQSPKPLPEPPAQMGMVPSEVAEANFFR